MPGVASTSTLGAELPAQLLVNVTSSCTGSDVIRTQRLMVDILRRFSSSHIFDTGLRS